LLPAYSDLGYRAGEFPVTEGLATRELSLPMFPELSESQTQAVVAAVKAFSQIAA
jgi:dTDP-4-amino-4,6-dideoxygalactose transaminase